MNKKNTKYPSPSTSGVSHDLSNFIVEALLINRHGALPEAGWRKGQALTKEWGRILTCVRRVKNTLGVELSQLAWYIQFYKITNINYEDFGLLRWKIKKYFKWCNIDKFTSYYIALHKQLVDKRSNYIENSTGYKTKTSGAGSGNKKTLSEILEELENSG